MQERGVLQSLSLDWLDYPSLQKSMVGYGILMNFVRTMAISRFGRARKVFESFYALPFHEVILVVELLQWLRYLYISWLDWERFHQHNC